MAVTIEMQNTGDSRARREILAGVEHVLSDVAGEWRVSIVGSRANDNWGNESGGTPGIRTFVHFGWRCWRAPAGGNTERAYQAAAR